ncbi:tetratricopeptide repeat-containing sulfotransferase family protein [Thalassotalea piscium]
MNMTSKINKSQVHPAISSNQQQRFSSAEQAFTKQDFQTAESLYRQLIQENVQVPKIYTQLAMLCAMSNRIAEAKSLWTYALTIAPAFVDALLGLGDICKYEKNFIKAADYYKKVIAGNPQHALAYLNLSYCYKQIGKLNDSITACEKALAIAPNYIQAKEFLGQVLITKGDLTQAKQVLNSVLSENSKSVKALYALGNLLKSQGDFEQARECYQQIFSIQPEFSQAHFTYSVIHKYVDKNDPHVRLMQSQYQKPNINLDNKIQLCFALAKAFEDIQDYETAFKFLDEGNSLRFGGYNYHIDSDDLFIKNIIKIFNKEAISAINIETESSEIPIFIVGMPRSGTSLVEKILATHTKVHGAGELEYFFELGTSGLLSETSDFLFLPLNNYAKKTLQDIGKVYIEKIKSLTKEESYITDKLPFNMLLVGLIKLVLPNAKIIHCVRDAKDNCVSIYKKNFTTDNYRFAYNLKALGQFHRLYTELMAHWHLTFPGEIYDVHYESLISNPEIEIRKLIKACGLEWQEECLNFHKSKAVVTTASAYQVRQPIYNSSVGLWQKYESFLSPLLNELDKS